MRRGVSCQESAPATGSVVHLEIELFRSGVEHSTIRVTEEPVRAVMIDVDVARNEPVLSAIQMPESLGCDVAMAGRRMQTRPKPLSLLRFEEVRGQGVLDTLDELQNSIPARWHTYSQQTSPM
jgi:hypothetical protein